VPKFLQAHSHLLHKGPKPDEPRIVKEQDDSDIEDYDGVRSLRSSAHTTTCFVVEYPISHVTVGAGLRL